MSIIVYSHNVNPSHSSFKYLEEVSLFVLLLSNKNNLKKRKINMLKKRTLIIYFPQITHLHSSIRLLVCD